MVEALVTGSFNLEVGILTFEPQVFGSLFCIVQADERRNCKVSPGRLGFVRAAAVNESVIAPSEPAASAPPEQVCRYGLQCLLYFFLGILIIFFAFCWKRIQHNLFLSLLDAVLYSLWTFRGSLPSWNFGVVGVPYLEA